MTRRVSAAVVMTFAMLVLLPGVASAQTGSPPAVAGVVIESPTTAAPIVLGQSLPRTGSNLVPMLAVAVVLMVLGVLLVVGVRRQRTDDVRLA